MGTTGATRTTGTTGATGATGATGTLPLHALFQKRIDGDDALLRLARRRFEQAGLAAEVYAGSLDELEWVLPLTPAGARPPTVHLARGVDLLRPADREGIAAFARRFGYRVAGFVVHDRREMPDRLDDVEAAAAELSPVLAASGSAALYVEYAAGCRPEQFVEVAQRLARHDRVGVCVDTGHVGIRAARRAFDRVREGEPDIADLPDLAELDAADPRLPDLVGAVQACVAAGLPAVRLVLRGCAALGLPLHLHLHDGHPLIRGLSDHRGFLTRLPIPFAVAGRRSLDPLYGPAGLAAIVAEARAASAHAPVSLTLEIHERDGRLPIGADADLFGHWRDVRNAERMNAWLVLLAENAQLVSALDVSGLEACR